MDATALPAATERESRLCTRLALLVLAVVGGLLLDGAWRVGPTFDEHFYVATGYAYLQEGEFALNREHPPLAKLLCGLPLLLAGDVRFPEHWRDQVSYPTTFFYQLNAEHLRRNLFLARLPFCLLTLVLGWAVFATARRLASPRAGLVALLLFGLNPSVLAHGRLAALDMAVTVFLFLSAVAWLRALEDFTWRRQLAAAVLFGLANLAKFTALVLAPFFALSALVAAARARSLVPLRTFALTALGGLSVFAAGYGFEAKSVNEAWSEPQYVVEHRDPPVHDVRPADLAAVAREEGMGPDEARLLARAPALDGAIELLGQVLATRGVSDALTRSALVALREVRLASAADRKRAFAAVLEAALARGEDGDTADHGREALELSVLGDLADLRFESLEGFRAWYAQNRDLDWNRMIFTQGWIEALARGLFGDARPIPLFTALKGIDYQLYHGSFGHGSYFRGQTLLPLRDFRDGNPYPEFYAWVLAIKNPLAWLALVLLGIGLAVVPAPGWTLQRALVFLVLPLALFALFSKGNALLGVRYLLPTFPFLAVLGGRVATRWPRAALALALVAILEWIWIHPHELMYYNAAAGGPEGGPRISVVGDDWGQDVDALGRFYERWKPEIEAAGGLHYDPYTAGDLAVFGLEAAHPVEGPVEGIVAVNAVNYYREQHEYGWLADYEPFLRIGWSVWVYDTRVPPPGGSPLEAWRAARR